MSILLKLPHHRSQQQPKVLRVAWRYRWNCQRQQTYSGHQRQSGDSTTSASARGDTAHAYRGIQWHTLSVFLNTEISITTILYYIRRTSAIKPNSAEMPKIKYRYICNARIPPSDCERKQLGIVIKASLRCPRNEQNIKFNEQNTKQLAKMSIMFWVARWLMFHIGPFRLLYIHPGRWIGLFTLSLGASAIVLPRFTFEITRKFDRPITVTAVYIRYMNAGPVSVWIEFPNNVLFDIVPLVQAHPFSFSHFFLCVRNCFGILVSEHQRLLLPHRRCVRQISHSAISITELRPVYCIP